ncbi:ATP-binding protein [Paenibacillus thermotolerans]|uniref:ATP-binding protein n=1 Tax=Paenibacillus thermotolerans TaxID=3027807 RepID=UPI002367E7E4|nr:MULTISPECIES: ATP-binding protein [unclassified Paenibacillus]
MQWIYPSRIGNEKGLLQKIKTIAIKHGASQDRAEDMASAVAEACLNAAEHGNSLRTERHVTVSMTVDGGMFRFRVYDEGPGFQESTGSIRGNDVLTGRARGWGMTIMAGLSDELRFDRDVDGFYAELGFRIGPGEGGSVDEQ